MSVAKVRFDEQIAARYDETSVHMYRPEVLDPAVDFLEKLAGDGAALEFVRSFTRPYNGCSTPRRKPLLAGHRPL